MHASRCLTALAVVLLLPLGLTACDSGDDASHPLAGTWAFDGPADQPLYVRITPDGDGYRSQSWSYYAAPDDCFYRDASDDARLEPLGRDRYRVTEGGDVTEVTITVSGDVLTVGNGAFSSRFTRSDRSLTPVCDEPPGG